MNLPAVVTVKPTPLGVELHALANGRRVVLALGALDGLTLADDLSRACEQKIAPGLGR